MDFVLESDKSSPRNSYPMSLRPTLIISCPLASLGIQVVSQERWWVGNKECCNKDSISPNIESELEIPFALLSAFTERRSLVTLTN
jgi:hypothetical protein